MITVNVFTNEIRPDGELVDRLAATFQVRGQELTVIDGNARFLQVGIPVYSERYGRLIDFDTDGEEWARNLPSAYRNGTMTIRVDEITEPAAQISTRHARTPALAVQQARQRH